MKWLIPLFLLIFVTSTIAKEQVHTINNQDGTLTVRIPLNYESLNNAQAYLRGARSDYIFKLPLAARWIVLNAKIKLFYTPSIVVLPERSSLSISFNEKTVAQKWINKTDRGLDNSLEASLPPSRFKEYNQITVNGFQHYAIDHCEDESAPELWTKIDTRKSYIELNVLPRTLESNLNTIDTFLFDYKNISRQQIAFVFPEKRNSSMASGAAIVASTIGKKLKYRDVNLTVHSTIPAFSDTIVVATKNELINLLNISFDKDAGKLISQIDENSILFFANPLNPKYGIVCITGENDDELLVNAQAFASYDFVLYKSNGVKIENLILPKESKAYTAPNYLLADQKITFKELGKKTTSFKYMYPAPMELNFKMYPDLFFNDKQKITIGINGAYPTKVRFDSVLNIGLNEQFAAQLPFDEKLSKEVSVSKFFNFKDSDSFPAYLIAKGKNKLSIQPAMIPFKEGFCEVYNMENLQTTILNNSYIVLPNAPHWLEMPYLRYFLYAAYPFSIYPDGSHSAIIIDSFSSQNLKASLKIAFFLGREIEYPLYRIKIDTTIEDHEDKELIYISQYSNSNAQLMENAQVKIEGNSFSTKFPLIYKFVDYLPFFNSDRLNHFRNNKSLQQSRDASKNMLVQLFQSSYNSNRSIISIQYNTPDSLSQGIDILFAPEQEIGWNSDTLIIHTDLKNISSFELGNKYFLGTLSLFDQIRFYITENPWFFGIMSLLLLLLMTYIIRLLLHTFKHEHHPHV